MVCHPLKAIFCLQLSHAIPQTDILEPERDQNITRDATACLAESYTPFLGSADSNRIIQAYSLHRPPLWFSSGFVPRLYSGFCPGYYPGNPSRNVTRFTFYFKSGFLARIALKYDSRNARRYSSSNTSWNLSRFNRWIPTRNYSGLYSRNPSRLYSRIASRNNSRYYARCFAGF